MVRRTQYTRSQTAKKLMDEIKAFTGKSVKYPKSNYELQLLKNEIERLWQEKEKIKFTSVLDEIKRFRKPDKKSRDEKVKRLLTEYKELTGNKVKYPFSNTDIQKIKDDIKNIYSDRINFSIELTQSSYHGIFKTYRLRINDQSRELNEIIQDVIKFIQHEYGRVKVIIKIHALLKRPTNQ